MFNYLHLFQFFGDGLVVLEGILIQLLPQFLLDLVSEDVGLGLMRFLLAPRTHLYDLLPDNVADLLGSPVLVHHCHLEFKFTLYLVILVDVELEIETLID